MTSEAPSQAKPGPEGVLHLTASSMAQPPSPCPGCTPNPHCPELPVFDLAHYLRAAPTERESPELRRLCSAMADCLRTTSALVIRRAAAACAVCVCLLRPRCLLRA